jgi:transcriptional regulator with XRE-family HTH domain
MVDRSRDPLLSAFGSAVRSLRLARGLSQESLAEAAHLHVTYVSSLERGRRNVSLVNIDRLARALGVDLPGLMAPIESKRRDD